MIERHIDKEKDTAPSCPSADIAAYIDGELSPEAELAFDLHLTACRVCSEELNAQKMLVNALDGSLGSELHVPDDFTKRIVTHAEGSVSGLRRRAEWPKAVVVSVTLLFFVLFTLGAAVKGTFFSLFGVIGQVVAVVGFVIHFLFDLAVGAVVVLRNFGDQPGLSALGALLLTGIVFIVLYSSSLIRSNKENRRSHRE